MNSRGRIASWVAVILVAVAASAFSQTGGLLVGVTGGFALRMWDYARMNRLTPSRGLRLKMALLVVAFVGFLALSAYFMLTGGCIPYRGRCS